MRYEKSRRLAKVLAGALLPVLVVGGCGGVMPGTCFDGGYPCPNGNGASAQRAESAAERAQQAAERAQQAAQRAEQAAEKAGNIFDQGMQK